MHGHQLLDGINAGLSKVSWQGMQAAAAAHPNITVKYLRC
jgi:hypothetical protein